MIGRRGFLAALGALVAAPFAPVALQQLELRFAPGTFERVCDPDTGIALRFVQQYDIVADRLPTRIDVWYGRAIGDGVQQIADKVDEDLFTLMQGEQAWPT